MTNLREMEPDEFLQALITGDLSPDAEAVRARFESDPELERRWHELQATCVEVEEALGDVRESLEGEGDGDGDDWRVDVQAAMGSAFPSRWPVQLPLVAAVVLATILLWVWGPWKATPDPFLGGAAPVLTPDDEASPDYAVFSWEIARSDIDHYVVVVSDFETGETIDVSDPLEEKRWEPGEERRQWPARIRWKLIGYDLDDREDFSITAVTWRE